jgi:hypothetical protein
MLRRFLLSLTLLSLCLAAVPVSAYAFDAVDFSYDKCRTPGSSEAASSVGHYDLAILGVNGGGDWEKNPCLHDQLRHVDKYFLYVNTNYPSDQCHDRPSRKAAYHCGYNVGLWDLNYASRQGASSNLWFEDVETSNGWSGKDSYNAVFLYGLAKALEAHGVYVGFYSTSYQWEDITGGWKPGGFGWYATGSNGKPSDSVIRDACRSGFTGGSVVYYQC